MGIGTTVYHFLNAILEGSVVYDLRISISIQGEAKNRPQWRLSVTRDFETKLGTLYSSVEHLDVGSI